MQQCVCYQVQENVKRGQTPQQKSLQNTNSFFLSFFKEKRKKKIKRKQRKRKQTCLGQQIIIQTLEQCKSLLTFFLRAVWELTGLGSGMLLSNVQCCSIKNVLAKKILKGTMKFRQKQKSVIKLNNTKIKENIIIYALQFIQSHLCISLFTSSLRNEKYFYTKHTKILESYMFYMRSTACLTHLFTLSLSLFF